MPEGTILAGSHVEPEHLTLAVLIDADSDHHRHADDAVFLPHLDERRVQLHVGVAPIELAGPKALYLCVQRLAQPADLAFGDAADAERFGQVVHTPGIDTVDVRLLNHCHQCTLTTAARLQQGRVVATITYTRHPQLNAPDASVPIPIAIAVTLPGAVGPALVLLGPDVLGDFELHQLLGHCANALA